jgi:hypothetical protein
MNPSASCPALQQRPFVRATDPDRDYRLGDPIESDAVERVPLSLECDVRFASLECDVRFAPEPAENLNLFFDAFSTAGEVHPGGLVLGVVPADTDAQLKAPAAQLLQFRTLFCDDDGRVQRQNQDGRSEMEPRGECRKVGKQDELIVKWAGAVVRWLISILLGRYCEQMAGAGKYGAPDWL